jgi:hypothetical protein
MNRTNREPKTVEAQLRNAEETRKRRMEDSPFHCFEQWHLANLKPACALVYPLLYKIAKPVRVGAGDERRLFYASVENLALYFGKNRSTIDRAIKDLIKHSFLEKIKQVKFQPTQYRVVSHEEWASRHPGQCAEMLQFPYSGEIDTLGQTLFTISGGTVKFNRFQVNNIRKLGIRDEDAYTEFATYMDGPGQSEPVRRIPKDFYIKMKKLYAR